MDEMRVELVPIDEIKPYERNAKKHDKRQIANVAESIRQFGFKQPCVIDGEGVIIIGHCRYYAAKKLRMKAIPCIRAIDLSPEDVNRLRIIDNKTNESDWDTDALALELMELNFDDFDFDFEENNISRKYSDATPGALKRKFIMPPFSVLDARQGDWQRRKRAWMQIVRSGSGRSDALLGQGLYELAQTTGANVTGTSIFDPVLTEVLINWYCPKGGRILDCFAGGSVRGIVSQFLQREYHGNDLSAQQIAANADQFEELKSSTDFFGQPLAMPHWYTGDSRDIDAIIAERDFDMLITCPPYGDLETYSDDPADISNMSYADFLVAYREIFAKSIAMLKDNAFVVVVVGEIRDRDGYYRDFIGDTVKAVEAGGARYYNECILITMGATLPLRAGRLFEQTRKLSNTHQKALVFLKSSGNEEALVEWMKTFDETREITQMKKSILVFLKGNAKLAKADIEHYCFDAF